MRDFKHTVDHESDAKAFDAEFEPGSVIVRDWAVSVRLLDSAIDSNRRWGAVAHCDTSSDVVQGGPAARRPPAQCSGKRARPSGRQLAMIARGHAHRLWAQCDDP